MAKRRGKGKPSKAKLVKEFKKEINKPRDVNLRILFYEVLKKEDISNLPDIEIRALFYRVMLMSDEERERFKEYLYLENMTEDEVNRYQKILPQPHLREKFFPSKETMEANNKEPEPEPKPEPEPEPEPESEPEEETAEVDLDGN